MTAAVRAANHDGGIAEPADSSAIAIVGIGLRVPGGARTLDEFADFLAAGESGIRDVPADRWDVEAFAPDSDEDRGAIRTTRGGFLERVDEFDPGFFNISPKEAQFIDPQQRMVLETAWEALEDANIDPTTLKRSDGGVFMGASSIDYALELESLPYDAMDGHLASGITMFPISGRVSYVLGLRGPSVSIDTACSSSLVAMHQAAAALRSGECDLALCGGVNALHHPRIPVMFSNAQMLAPDGHCKTFDEAADGYARAEGCVVIAMTTAARAREAGYRVLGYLRGSAVGQDGDSAGLTVPNGVAQERVMGRALRAAELDTAEIQYVEAHGTGTPLGDPIEVGAIASLFSTGSRAEPVQMASTKGNLGHMEPASGLVGVARVLAQFRRSEIFTHVGMSQPSARIPWASYPVEVPLRTTDWAAGEPRRALVNSFGFAGTIAAVVLEEAVAADAPPPSRASAEDDQSLLVFSAKSPDALAELGERHANALRGRSPESVAAYCATAASGRGHFAHRVAVCAPAGELVDAVQRAGEEPGAAADLRRKVAFLFTGQGSQYPGMAAPVHTADPDFARDLEECCALFDAFLDQPLLPLLLDSGESVELLSRTEFTQPALFAFEYAMAKRWIRAGVRPSVLVGHSIGELVAAAVAGVFTLEEAVGLVAERSAAMGSVEAAGGMVALATDRDTSLTLIEECRAQGRVALASVNAPDQCVVSGESAALADVTELARQRGVRTVPLVVSHAFHSPLMEGAADRVRAAFSRVTARRPLIPIMSNLTGTTATKRELADPEYWVQQLLSPVQFQSAIDEVAGKGPHLFVEVGPAPSLTGLGQRCVGTGGPHAWVASARQGDDSVPLRSIGEAYQHGASVDFRAVLGAPTEHVELPTYPFRRDRYWLPKARAGAPLGRGATRRHPVLGADLDHGAAFVSQMPEASVRQPHLAAGDWLSHLMAAHHHVLGEPLIRLRGVTFGPTPDDAVDLGGEDGVTIRTELSIDPSGSGVRVVADPEDAEHLVVQAGLASGDPSAPVRPDLGAQLRVLDVGGIGIDLASVGRGDRATELPEVLGLWEHEHGWRLQCASSREEVGRHLPIELIDVALATLVRAGVDGAELSLRSVADLTVWRSPRGNDLDVIVTRSSEGRFDVGIWDGDRPIATLTGLVVSAESSTFVHELVWESQDAPGEAGSRASTVLICGPGDGASLAAVAPEGVQAVLAAGTEAMSDGLPEGVTDVVWIGPEDADHQALADLVAQTERAFTDLLDTIAALKTLPPSSPVRLWVLTGDAGTTAGTSAAIWGFTRTVLTEHPRFRPTLIEVGQGTALPVVWDELARAGRPEYQLRLDPREGRQVRRVRPVRQRSEQVRPTVDRDKNYVITGGLGGLGLTTADWLVASGARHLVLVSRSGSPSPEVESVLSRLRLDAQVEVVAADVSTEDGVAVLLDHLSHGPAVGGVVHAAGEIGKCLVDELDWPAIEHQLGPKMFGGWLLDRASRSWPELDFFVVYSSIAGVMGGGTQAHYAAASTYLDALVAARREAGLPGTSINWGAWASAGMSARLDPVLMDEIERAGVRFFSPDRALDALGEALSSQARTWQVGEYVWDAMGNPAVRDQLYEYVGSADSDGAGEASGLRELDPAERLRVLGDLVASTVARIMQFPDAAEVDRHRDLQSMGMDSLMSMDLKSSLERTLGVALSASAAYDHPTVTALGGHLDDQIVSAS